MIRRAVLADRDVTVRGVVAAFATDPLLRWLWPDDERYGPCASHFFGLLFDLRLERSAVWVDGEGRGASSSWNPPGGLGLDPDAERRRWESLVADYTPAERERLSALGETMRPLSPPRPVWYLAVLAVHPAAQGRGLGTALAATGLAEADADRLPTYLETSNAANLGFYARLGFAVSQEVRLPADGPLTWVLVRPRQGSPA